MTLPDLQAMAAEPLDPALAAYLTEIPALGPFVKHPLVFGSAAMPGFLNRQLQHKRDVLVKALARGDYEQALWLHERPYRLSKLGEWLAEGCFAPDTETFGYLLLQAWRDTEFPRQFGPLPLKLFRRAGRFLTDAPHLWAALGERVDVWRGEGDGKRPSAKRGALSWTLARGCAEWYARRFAPKGKPGTLWHGWINRADAFAYIEARGEAEVVVAPRFVHDLRKERMGAPE